MLSDPIPARAALLAGLFVLTAAGLGADGALRIEAVESKSAPVEDLVVWLTPLDAPPPPPAPADSLQAVVEQRGEQFHPYVLAVRTGTRVTFPNRDTVQHHVYSLAQPAQFEIPLHGGESDESVVLAKPGIVPVGCNIHDWMLAHLVVVDSPWFAQTGADGRLSLTGVPAGRYRLEAWHPRLRTSHTEEITVVDGQTAERRLELRLRPDRRVRRAPDAGGDAY